MIKAIIFDMDGVLIDSEPSWIAAEIDVFAGVGVQLTRQLCEETTGFRRDATVRYWYDRFPWSGKTCAQVADEIAVRVGELIGDAPPLPGVREIIDEALARDMVLALCSSSPPVIIRKVVAKLGLSDVLLVHSAEEERYGKPHPAAYMTTADRCGVAYRHCLVFEDSLTGAIAGKAASMHVVAVPQGEASNSTRFDFCDEKMRSLTEFDTAAFDRFGAPAREDLGERTSTTVGS